MELLNLLLSDHNRRLQRIKGPQPRQQKTLRRLHHLQRRSKARVQPQRLKLLPELLGHQAPTNPPVQRQVSLNHLQELPVRQCRRLKHQVAMPYLRRQQAPANLPLPYQVLQDRFR